ncbi:hypothetical protein Scep_014681 [Stephania cephalantha]|uniref:Uncharacterized protein n=1 Tax=Stephania cephalantha TaxID=152367 RepID=A0AAP0J339_9MAGN
MISIDLVTRVHIFPCLQQTPTSNPNPHPSPSNPVSISSLRRSPPHPSPVRRVEDRPSALSGPYPAGRWNVEATPCGCPPSPRRALRLPRAANRLCSGAAAASALVVFSYWRESPNAGAAGSLPVGHSSPPTGAARLPLIGHCLPLSLLAFTTGLVCIGKNRFSIVFIDELVLKRHFP